MMVILKMKQYLVRIFLYDLVTYPLQLFSPTELSKTTLFNDLKSLRQIQLFIEFEQFAHAQWNC